MTMRLLVSSGDTVTNHEGSPKNCTIEYSLETAAFRSMAENGTRLAER